MIEETNDEWIVGSKAITAFLKKGCWKTTKGWIKRYHAPMRRWIDGRPAFIRAELNAWLINTGEAIGPVFESDAKKSKTNFNSLTK